jgi:hypothetical protein
MKAIPTLDYDTAWQLVGGLSKPSKMPCYGWSISALDCKMGGKLHEIENSVCSGCYARKGNYMFPCVQNAMARRLKAIRHKSFVSAMVFLLKCLDSRYFRWMDSGDLQDVQMLNKIAEIARACPEVSFWLPTKEYGIVSSWFKMGNIRPMNLNIRLSGYMIDESGPITLARRLGVTISKVSRGQFTCPSSKQGNKCQTCRACWDSSTFNVIYKKH